MCAYVNKLSLLFLKLLIPVIRHHMLHGTMIVHVCKVKYKWRLYCFPGFIIRNEPAISGWVVYHFTHSKRVSMLQFKLKKKKHECAYFTAFKFSIDVRFSEQKEVIYILVICGSRLNKSTLKLINLA